MWSVVKALQTRMVQVYLVRRPKKLCARSDNELCTQILSIKS